MSTINFYTFAATLASEIGSMYVNTREQRRKLREYLSANDWFGLNFAAESNAELCVTADEAVQTQPRLILWLSALEQSHGTKTKLLLEYFKEQFPDFCRLFSEFIENKNIDNTFAYWHLLDYLFGALTKDILEYSETEAEVLVARLGVEMPLNSAMVFGEFLSWLSGRGNGISGWQYKFHRREQPGVNHTAYSMRQFSTAAYFIFNKTAWEQQNLIAKAVGNRLYADLWVFAALNVFCALRVGDLKRLPAPRLPIGVDEIHTLALSGDFPKSAALAITQDFESRIKLLPMMPSKTEKHDNVPTLKLFVPESLREPLGMFIAIALAHRPEVKPGEPFIVARENHKLTEEFFGSEFVTVVGRFIPRRCNKAYLQGIDAVGGADNAPGKPKGYMLAALARSHKGGYGTLGNTTDVYLKDARFAGYTPEFIAKEMFERGVFSFIPAILLEMYAGERYKQLPVRAQTSLIKQLGYRRKTLNR